MPHDLSPQSESYLHQMVAGGLYPSTDAALEAAVSALHQQTANVPPVPDEHLASVEEALSDLEAGIEEPFTADDWSALREAIRNAAAKGSGS